MIAAVVIAVGVMLVVGRRRSATFVDRHPTMKMLALSFLLLIGVMLVAEGFGQHIPKGYIYFAMAFSVGVEFINMRLRAKATPVDLRHSEMPGADIVWERARSRADRPLEERGRGERPPARLDAADDGLARHGAPVAAVGAAVAMVAHHHVVVGRHRVRAPVLVAAEVRRHVAVVQLTAVDHTRPLRMRTTSPSSAMIRFTNKRFGATGTWNMTMSPGVGFPMRYVRRSTTSRSWLASVGAMLWPSTRASCTVNPMTSATPALVTNA